MIKEVNKTKHKSDKASPKHSMGIYITILFVVALLLLLLAYFTEERYLAQSAAQFMQLV